jgi:hypothetical protein
MMSLIQEFIDKYPEAPVALLKSYRRARDVAFDRIYGTDPEIVTISWVAAMINEQRVMLGDHHYWAYNVTDNMRLLEAMALFVHQFGVTPAKRDYKSFLDPTAALAGV